MKKILFWVSFPFLMLIYITGGFMELIGGKIMSGMHAWEGWCLDYKKKRPDLEHKGDGIWVSKRDK